MVSLIDLRFTVGSREQLFVDNINKMDHILTRDEREIKRILEHIRGPDSQKGDLEQLKRDWKDLMKKTYRQLGTVSDAEGDLLIIESKLIREFRQARKHIDGFLKGKSLAQSGEWERIKKVRGELRHVFKKARKMAGGLASEARGLRKFDGVHPSAWVRAHETTMPRVEDVVLSIDKVLDRAKQIDKILNNELGTLLSSLARHHIKSSKGEETEPLAENIPQILADIEEKLKKEIELLLEAESYKLILMFKLMETHFKQEETLVKDFGLPTENQNELIKEAIKNLDKEKDHASRLSMLMNLVSMQFR